MVITEYLSFGYKIFKVDVNPGDIITGPNSHNPDGTYTVLKQYNPSVVREEYLRVSIVNDIALVTKGSVITTALHNMIPTPSPVGFCNLDQPRVLGLCHDEYTEPTTVFIISPYANIDKDPIMPNVSTLRWSQGNVIQPPAKFFLASGSFKKGDKTYSVPGTYELTSSSIEAVSDCLGFIFNN